MTEYAPAAGLQLKGQHVASGACSWGGLSHMGLQSRGHAHAGIALLDPCGDTCTSNMS